VRLGGRLRLVEGRAAVGVLVHEDGRLQDQHGLVGVGGLLVEEEGAHALEVDVVGHGELAVEGLGLGGGADLDLAVALDDEPLALGADLQLVLLEVADVELDLVDLAAVLGVLDVALVEGGGERRRVAAGGRVLGAVREGGGHGGVLVLVLHEELLAPPLAPLLELLHARLDAVGLVAHAAQVVGAALAALVAVDDVQRDAVAGRGHSTLCCC